MIPYFELREIPLAANYSLAAFGTLVTVGVFAGLRFSEHRARAAGIPLKELHGAVASALIPGFLLAHAVALIPHAGHHTPLSLATIAQFWNGMSSFGGFAGALLGLAMYYWRWHRPWLVTADVLMQGLVVGWVFGRLGCTLVHDHIGSPSELPLAIRFADGGRHDLGFYELLFTIFVLVPALLRLNRRPRRPGTSVAVLALLYAPARFLGDFLRNVDLAGADVRYGGLTLAQYACVFLMGIGVTLAVRIFKHRDRTESFAGCRPQIGAALE